MTEFSTSDSFWDRILANPDDRKVRLAYADWLEERGDPRGEFIRIQCRLARLGAGCGEIRMRLKSREQWLLEQYREQWAAPVRALAAGYQFRRGFIERVWLAVPQFLQRASRLFAMTPLRGVVLWGDWTQIRDLADSAQLVRLRHLGFERMWLAYRGAAVLAASPQSRSLHSLDLSNCGLCNTGLKAIAQSPFLSCLTVLRAAYNSGVGDEGLTAIVNSQHLVSLKCLSFARCRITDGGARTLAMWPHLSGLRRLNLRDNRISMAGFDALLSSPFWSPRTRLIVAPSRRAALRKQFGDALVHE